MLCLMVCTENVTNLSGQVKKHDSKEQHSLAVNDTCRNTHRPFFYAHKPSRGILTHVNAS